MAFSHGGTAERLFECSLPVRLAVSLRSYSLDGPSTFGFFHVCVIAVLAFTDWVAP